jgi:hypothetical protein
MFVLLVLMSFLLSQKPKKICYYFCCSCCYHHHYHQPFLTFMQGIYNYILDTNHVSKVYSVAAVP